MEKIVKIEDIENKEIKFEDFFYDGIENTIIYFLENNKFEVENDYSIIFMKSFNIKYIENRQEVILINAYVDEIYEIQIWLYENQEGSLFVRKLTKNII